MAWHCPWHGAQPILSPILYTTSISSISSSSSSRKKKTYLVPRAASPARAIDRCIRKYSVLTNLPLRSHYSARVCENNTNYSLHEKKLNKDGIDGTLRSSHRSSDSINGRWVGLFQLFSPSLTSILLPIFYHKQEAPSQRQRRFRSNTINITVLNERTPEIGASFHSSSSSSSGGLLLWHRPLSRRVVGLLLDRKRLKY